MYEGLVERLHKRIALTCACSPLQEELLEAVNAIEKMSAFCSQITDGRFYFAKDGVLLELKNDPRNIRISSPWLPEPPKEET